MPALEQDVFGLHVPMDHALGVGIGECVRHLVQDAHRVRHRELPFARQSVAQGLPGNEGHHVEEQIALRPGAEHREDVGVLQVGGELDLLLEARLAHLARELGRQQLDHHGAV